MSLCSLCVNACVPMLHVQVLIMMYLVDSLDSKARVTVLQSFYALFKELTALEQTAPSLFPEVGLCSDFPRAGPS